jgi:ribonucleoside-diphosphate reductase alpha chain
MNSADVDPGTDAPGSAGALFSSPPRRSGGASDETSARRNAKAGPQTASRTRKTARRVSTSGPSASAVDATRLFQGQEDAPPCSNCGLIMIRNGSCYKCANCGSTSGCS